MFGTCGKATTFYDKSFEVIHLFEGHSIPFYYSAIFETIQIYDLNSTSSLSKKKKQNKKEAQVHQNDIVNENKIGIRGVIILSYNTGRHYIENYISVTLFSSKT